MHDLAMFIAYNKDFLVPYFLMITFPIYAVIFLISNISVLVDLHIFSYALRKNDFNDMLRSKYHIFRPPFENREIHFFSSHNFFCLLVYFF